MDPESASVSRPSSATGGGAGPLPGRSLPRVLITAGPTHEPIDEVRYLGNRSSGRLGMELAKASARRGSPTTLLLGPVPLDQDLPADVEVVRFTTSRDLEQALARLGPGADVLIMAAAVADHRPATVHKGKWRREAGEASIALEVVPDLVAGFAASRPEIDGARRPLVVAFALEPRAELESSARAKLARKGVEMIVANPIETLGADSIEPMLIAADGRSDRPRPNGIGVSKNDFATWLLDRVTEALAAPIRGS